ncbi:MAG TPA: DUF2231 domain-containing protein [Streptosporangiaceae bacterium]|nr:DUF2231 domain-containing protein [Streptosporangiaceae bacterium]
MSDELAQVKHPVSATLAGPYGHPYHPVLVTVPVGAWVTSLIFDIASHLTASPGFLTRGSSWLIAIGLIGGLAAAATGFLDLIVIPVATPASRTAIWHMTLMLTAMAAYVANLAWRHGSHDAGGPVPAGPLAVSVATLAVVTVAGYLGGKLSFRYGVRVAAESAQADGYRQQPARHGRSGQALLR